MKKIFFLSSFAALLLPIAASADMGYGDTTTYWGDHMMSWMGSTGGFLWAPLMMLMYLIWLVAGVLIIIWLWKQINKKK